MLLSSSPLPLGTITWDSSLLGDFLATTITFTIYSKVPLLHMGEARAKMLVKVGFKLPICWSTVKRLTHLVITLPIIGLFWVCFRFFLLINSFFLGICVEPVLAEFAYWYIMLFYSSFESSSCAKTKLHFYWFYSKLTLRLTAWTVEPWILWRFQRLGLVVQCRWFHNMTNVKINSP